ncbi:hypothetical protein BH10ACI1_BH10ACI1_08830 [soil metagenome]
MHNKFIGKLLIAIFVVLFSNAAFGQTDQARIVGVISDSVGAVIVRA